MRRGSTIGLIVVSTLAGCSGDPVAPPEATYTISVRSGSAQQGPAGSLLLQPLQVTVVDVANQPVRGVVVRFRALSGGSLTDTIGVTALAGVAQASARLGPTQGEQRFQAFLSRAPQKMVEFSVTATAGAVLTAVEPSAFEPGDTVIVRGDNFNTDPLGNSVVFGTGRGRILSSVGDTELEVVVPACLAPGSIAVRVEVGSAVTNTIQATYGSTTPVLSLGIGEAITVSGTELGRCVQLVSNGPRYLVVPQFASAASEPSPTQFQIGRGDVPPIVGPAPSPLAGLRPQTAQQRVDARMRAIERQLAPIAARQGNEPERVALEGLTLNSERSFSIISDLGEPEEAPTFATSVARLKYIGTHILIYVDKTAPAALLDADVNQLGSLFDNRLYDLNVETFGSESDIDGNGKVIVLMSPRVNALVTAAECNLTGFVAGYFYPNDLIRNNSNSNRGEVFYTLVPDPDGDFGCTQSTSFVKRLVPGTFIHEFQHMISYNQHVLARGGSSEDVWLNEGLSLIAEEAAGRFYEERGDVVRPGQIFPDSATPYLRDIIGHAYDYLKEPTSHSVTTFESFGSLRERGAAWLFLRWLGDQKGNQIFGQLVQTKTTSVENVQERAGESFAALFGDFALACVADLSTITGFSRTSLSSRHRFKPRRRESSTQDYRFIFSQYLEKQPTVSSPIFGPTQAEYEIPSNGGVLIRSMPSGTMSFMSFRTSTLPGPSIGMRFTTPTSVPFPLALGAQVGIVRVQ
jgi:hypothetical protein